MVVCLCILAAFILSANAIEPAEFSPDSTVFSSSQSVALSAPDAGTSIYYTTDGSDPTSANGTLYTGPLDLTSTTILRARAQLSDADAGPTTERRYVRLASDLQSFTSPLPIVVLDNFDAGAVPQRNSSTGPNGNDGSGVIQVERQPMLMAIYDRDELSGQASPSDAPAITSFAGLRVRGSSSSGLSKKSFSLETWEDGEIENSDNINPFGMPSESDWVLYAPTEDFSGNRYDRPLLHNSFIYQLSNEIGRYAARTQFVEVFLNQGGGDLSMADYAGLYIFMESRKRDGDRIDFPKMSADGTTGGWMINVDRMDPQPMGGGTPRHFHTPGPNRILETADDSAFGVRNRDDRPEFYHSFFNFESPGGYDITPAQRTIVQDAMNAFEDALYGANWTDPAAGYAAHIDVANFIDQYILQNLTKNQDAYVLSTLLYKAAPDQPIRFGPVWDFDRGYTTSPTSTNPTSNLRFADDRMWFGRLFSDANFEQAYIDRWQELRAGAFATAHLHAIIDAQKAEITEAVAARNGTASWPSKVTAMKDWLTSRTAAIDAQFVPKPTFNAPDGALPEGFEVTIAAPEGDIYYTTDGTDPRLRGGGISPSAQLFASTAADVELYETTDDCRYFIPTDDSLGLAWTGDPASFDDSSWTLATPGLGWEGTVNGTLLAQITTTIDTEMRNVNASGYFRWNFDLQNVADTNTLTLSVTIDDGFVAYLNGTELGEFNAPDPTLWNSAATDRRTDSIVLSTPIVIDATPFIGALVEGGNTIGLHGLNRNSGDSDFLISCKLDANRSVAVNPIILNESTTVIARAKDGNDWSGPTSATYSVGSEAASATNIAISEIMYNPSAPTQAEIDAGVLDGDQFEYIELMNIGTEDVDLAGAAFTDGIDYTFPVGAASILTPGARLVLAKNPTAFALRHPGVPVAGTFENDTNLRDSGENITLSAIDTTPIRDFAYDDKFPWPEAADGDGYSLVLIAPSTNPDHALTESWRHSALPDGTPTTTDATTFPGGSDSDFLTYATGGGGLAIDPAMALTFPRNLAADDIALEIQTSTDLETWSAAIDIQVLSEIANGDGTSTLTYQILGAPSRYFFRLEASER